MRFAECFFRFAENFLFGKIRKHAFFEKAVKIIADKPGKMGVFDRCKTDFIINGIGYFDLHNNSPFWFVLCSISQFFGKVYIFAKKAYLSMKKAYFSSGGCFITAAHRDCMY